MPEILERSEGGQFRKVRLDPDEASIMGQKKGVAARKESATTLLQEAGYDPETAPEHLRLLAEYAASTKAGAVIAMRDFLKLTGQAAATESGATYETLGHYVPPEPGGRCPRCGVPYVTFESQQVLAAALVELRRLREEREGPE